MSQLYNTLNTNQLIDETFYNTQSMLMPLVGMLENVFFRCKNDSSFTMEYISSDCLQLTGYSSDDFMGKKISFAGIIHPDDINSISVKIGEAVAEKKPFKVIYRINTAQETEKWLLCQAEAEFSTDGAVTFLNGFLIDITERKQALDNLEKPRKFYESIFETIPIELVVLDTQFRYLFCNKTALNNEELRAWIIGKTDLEYCEYRNREKAIAYTRMAKMQEAMETHNEIEWEEVTKDKQGITKYHLRRYSPILDPIEGVKLVIGYGFDITERRKTEEKVKENGFLLKSINANISDGIYRYNPAKGFLYLNNAFAIMFGYTNYKDVMNHQKAFFVGTDSSRAIINSLQHAGKIKNKEFLLKRKDGKQFWALLSSTKLTDNDGEVYYDGIISDISELKKTEQLLTEKNNDLEKANNQLDKFIYSVSHDLRSPLSSILGIIQLVEQGKEDKDELLGLFKMIKKSVVKLDNFVEDVIDFYRNSRGEITTSTIDFKDLVEESVECFKYLAGADKIKVEINVKNSKFFKSDANRIRIILNNIICNAIKYHDFDKKNPYVTVTVNATESGTDLVIEDNGKGIMEQHIERIFDMFYRATSENIGSGLGLYIVKEAVEKLEGSIKVESKEGLGTKFSIHLPHKE